MILPGLANTELAGNPTSGRFKVELTGIPSDPDLAGPGTASSGLALIDLPSTLIEVCSDNRVPDAPAPVEEVLITLGVTTVGTGRLAGLATVTVAVLDSTVARVSTLESVYPSVVSQEYLWVLV